MKSCTKIFVKDKLNLEANDGWLLILFYVPLLACCTISMFNNPVIIIIMANLLMITIASLIGRWYVPSVFVVAALIFAIVNPIPLIAMPFSLIISFMIVVYSKRALNFLDRRYFWLNTNKMPKKTKTARAILWPFLVIVSFGVPLALIMRFSGSLPMSYDPILGIPNIVIIMPFAFLFSIIIVGYWRIQSIFLLMLIMLVAISVLGGGVFALLICIVTAITGRVIIIYYGNDNKISFVKVVKYVFKKDRGVNI